MADDGDRDSYRILVRENSDDPVVRTNGHGQQVELPRWFEADLGHPDFPTDVTLYVTVDEDEGPILAGIRAEQGATVTYSDVLKAINSSFSVTGCTGMNELLTWVAANAAGTFAAKKVFDPLRDKDEFPLTDENLRLVRETRTYYARRAFTGAKPRRRLTVTRELLREVAKVYRAAHKAGRPPTAAVAEHFEASHRTATRWVSRAREVGELGPALQSAPGEAESEEGAS